MAFAADAAPAKCQAVDLELALGIDVSGSIDDEEALLQRNVYIKAFRCSEIVKAIRSGFLRRIAVMYYEWAGFGHARVVADWMVISDRQSAYACAARLASSQRLYVSRFCGLE
jgi:hypothetical protein